MQQPLDDGSVWMGRHLRDGSIDTFGDDGNGRITLPACGPARARLIARGRRWRRGLGGFLFPARARRRQHRCRVRARQHAGGGFRAAGLVRDAAGHYVLAGDEGLARRRLRFLVDGQADAGFGGSGRVEVVLPSTNGITSIDALAVRPTAASSSPAAAATRTDRTCAITQLTETGAPDPQWGTQGIVDMPPPPATTASTPPRLRSTRTPASSSRAWAATAAWLLPHAGALRHAGRARARVRPAPVPSRRPAQPVSVLRAARRARAAADQRILAGAISFPIGAPFSHRTRYTLIRVLANGELDTSFGLNGWNTYTIADPTPAGQTGDYNQMHAIAHDRDDASVVILGRTFFEGASTLDDYVTMVRARLDLVFADGVEG